MESVDILDRLDIVLFQPVPGHYSVDFACKEKHKQLVIEPSARLALEKVLTEKCRDHSANDENTRGYIKEYVGRWLQKFHKLNLVAIEDVPEGTDDHYKHLRNQKLN
jgi:hypothetical protein